MNNGYIMEIDRLEGERGSLRAEVERLKAQRDLAWRTLARAKDALLDTDNDRVALMLSQGHTAEDAEEWNATTRPSGRRN